MNASQLTSGAGTPSNTSASDRLSELVQRMVSREHTEEMSAGYNNVNISVLGMGVWTIYMSIHMQQYIPLNKAFFISLSSFTASIMMSASVTAPDSIGSTITVPCGR